MVMVFESKKELVFVKLREYASSKTGKPFSIVTLADSDTFENCELFVRNKSDWDMLKAGQKVKCGLEVDGAYTSVIRFN